MTHVRDREKRHEPRNGLSDKELQKRKERVLTQGKASVTRSIADAVVIKEGDLFFLCNTEGNVPLDGRHGFGLYYHDCRYLNGYELSLQGESAASLLGNATLGYRGTFQLTNPDIEMENGTLVGKEDIGITWERVIHADQGCLHDTLTFQNYSLQHVEFTATLTFRSDFEDVFAIRGLLMERFGKAQQPRWHANTLLLRYEGKDQISRSLEITVDPPPANTGVGSADCLVKLEPRGSQQIKIVLRVNETERAASEKDGRGASIAADTETEWLEHCTGVETDSILLNSLVLRSLRDLRLLKTSLHGHSFFAAGVPWFVTLFGRDSIITALQTLAFAPEMAEGTLRLLARLQGSKVDRWRDEQPGKILHEWRIGEMARLGEIPHTPYYGTVDATPLFLILVERHARWTGDLSLFHDLRENIERALSWIDEYGDLDGDGYVEYESTSSLGLINQGWKDSGDAIVAADGSLATPPIALVEVQGYVYDARKSIASLYRRDGDERRASQLEAEAEQLRKRFNIDFWLKKEQFFTLALQGPDKDICPVITSNPGHALWSGIVQKGKARSCVRRLMEGDMYSGWGVRTLSTEDRRYNPLGYHLGTVWPHDNAIIVAGFRRYGFDKEALRIFSDIVDASTHFRNYRLPELYAGYAREDYDEPVSYPVACHPQAWAASSVPFMIQELLGLEADAFEKKLKITRPVLPPFVDRLEMRGLRVGEARADLKFTRAEGDAVAVEVLSTSGDIEIAIFK
jgi:glycogen debranching enzyme